MSHAVSYETHRAFMTPTRNSAVDLEDGEFFRESHSGLPWYLSSGNVLRMSDTLNRGIVSAALNLNPQLRREGVTDWLQPNRIAEHGAISDELIPIGYGIQMYAAFPTNSSAFNLPQEIPKWKVEFARYIARYGKTLSWQYSKQLVSRLQEILVALNDDSESDSSISIASLEGFFNFARQNLDLAFPQIALTPDGNIYARWKVDRQRLFSAQFLPKGDVRFVVFRPNSLHQNMTVRFSGLTTADCLIEEIRNHRVSAWVLEQQRER